MRRHLLLGALLALPPALLALASPTPFRAMAAVVPAVLAIVLLDRALAARFGGDTAFWITVLTAYGTAAFSLVAHEPDLRRSLALLAGAVVVALAPREGRWSPARSAAAVALALGGLACGRAFAGELGSPDTSRALFGSRHGLLFWSPVLWLGAAGLALELWRRRSHAAALAGIGLLPFVLSGLLPDGGDAARWDVALPALALGVATAWEAASAWLGARPQGLVAAALVLVGVPNLLFMEQYRDAPRRDDTVRFADVSEGNARRAADAVGSPVAWPANWAWSAAHGLPVERWDLQSGARLDPQHGARIDVGDLEQDATYLLDGWSVRHACGDAVCREVEGRAEMAVPLEHSATSLTVRGVGPGAVRVSANGRPLGVVALGPEPAETTLALAERPGMVRLAFEADPDAHAQVDAVSFAGGGR